MMFDDEPIAGENLPILPGHDSPGRFERVLRAIDMVALKYAVYSGPEVPTFDFHRNF